jgi:3-oxoacyl-[acyl-carrier protein] reductase
MDYHLKGRVAAVGGASAGLGYATALTLAQEGCRVVICSRNEDRINAAAQRIQEQTGTEVHALALDLNDPAAAREFVRQAQARFDQLDIVVSNTGGPPSGTFAQMTDAQWNSAIQSLLMCTVAMFGEALPFVQKSDQGRLIAITSLSAKQPLPNLVLSNAARAAIHGVIKTLSKEIAPTGVTVNAVCPGTVLTDRQTELAQFAANKQGVSLEEALKQRAAAVPMGRMGDPMEFAAAVAFLCSKGAGFITGSALAVDGGAFAGLP